SHSVIFVDCLCFSYYLLDLFFFFFFSSRRRHTRFSRDWSSDVCSSDLTAAERMPFCAAMVFTRRSTRSMLGAPPYKARAAEDGRSEERRVGKECRSRGSAGQ